MRKWVRYDAANDRVLELDEGRLKKTSQALESAYEVYKNGYGVEEVFQLYEPFIDKVLNGIILIPIDRAPITHAMRERLIPEGFHSVLNKFCDALEGRPAVYGHLDADTLMNHRDKFIKEENGKFYISEYFDN